MAATVAGPEPEIAAKNMQVATATRPSPPVKRPNRISPTSSRRREMPPWPIRSPARMKKGTAISGKESIEVTRLCAR